ncbi:MAG TPA: HEPN domain-containing protein [Candidatus Nanoarchaeia archaeon]|nr:HEPN domain-containing protein [Candidatus Nanoarchaeia archaeon]
MILYLKREFPNLNHYFDLLDKYRKLRHLVVYSLDFNIDKDDAKEAIKDAKSFLEKVKDE